MKVLIVYNHFYDNVPLGFYRFIHQELLKYPIPEIDLYRLEIPADDRKPVDLSKYEGFDAVVNLCPHTNEVVNKTTQKVFYFLDDMHSKDGNYENYFRMTEIADYLLCTYKYSPFVQEKWRDHLHKMIWFPHFAYPFIVRRPPVRLRIGVAGILNEKEYPFRVTMQRKFDANTFEHPGYDPKTVDKSKINEGFYKWLANFKFSVASGGGERKYIISKYFEIPFVKSILIGEDVGWGLSELGFKNGVNCYLLKKEEIDDFKLNYDYSIALEGYKLVSRHHMVGNRVQMLIRILDRLYSKGSIPYDFDLKLIRGDLSGKKVN